MRGDFNASTEWRVNNVISRYGEEIVIKNGTRLEMNGLFDETRIYKYNGPSHGDN